jgi:23S rRNA U2552 (ribose-2'-O)-methylase RlmE/FtsJ
MALEAVKPPLQTVPPWQTVRWYSPFREPLVDKTTFFISAPSAPLADVSGATSTPIPSAWSHTFTAEQAHLHTLRKRINDYEQECGQSEWEYYKKVVNPYEFVYTQKKYTDFPESICILHPLSRSYFKMVEMLNVMDFFQEMIRLPFLRSAHVCEGPGGFIEGFLDIASRKRQTVKTVTAMTLKPVQPNVPGWKRATSFLRARRNIKVTYGADGTGDLLNYENQEAFLKECAFKVHFFTGDGGFDFSTDYDAQEQTMFPLLVASARIGMEVLAEGGFFVLKFFDFYHEGTCDLLRFLSTQFRSWTLYKPATSRPCNPEHYFLGRGFKRPSAAALALIRSWTKRMCGPSPVAMPRLLDPATLPTSPPFSSILEELNAAAVRCQIAYLERVFHLIDSGELVSVKKQMLTHHEQVSYAWCRQFVVLVDRARGAAFDELLRPRVKD